MAYRVEVWNRFPHGEKLSSVDLPDTATPTAKYALEHGAKSTAEQMLGRFGVDISLDVITIPDAQTSEAIASEVETAHGREAAGETLPTTDDILSSEINI